MNLMYTERYGLLTLPHIYSILIMEVLRLMGSSPEAQIKINKEKQP